MPRKLFRLGVYALAIYRGHVILVRKGGGPYVGRWDLPGGGVEFGEAPLETLARELQEETGLAFAEAELFDVASLCVSYVAQDGVEENLHQVGILYRVTVDSLAGLKTDADGRDSLGSLVVPIGEAITLEMTPFAQLAIEKALVAARA
ncbi:MAG: NUDIX domain-containing protein [Limnochordales bacterium]